MALPESNILQLKDPGLASPDDWPVFNLKDAYVVSQKTGKAISLLSANKDHPVKVTGRLQPVEDDLLHLVKDSNYEDHIIEVSNVTSYAFAEYDDGSYGFWATGQAGWFQIEETLPIYKPTLEEMDVGASMLYFIADKLRRSRKTDFTQEEFSKHIQRLFKDFCGIGRYPARFTDADDVRDGFHDHREFLISSMFEGQEGINWEDALMMRYFMMKFPDDVNRIKARVLGIPSTLQQNKDQKKRKSQSPIPTNTQPKRRRGRPPKSSQPSVPKTPTAKQNTAFTSSDDDDEGESIVPRKRKSILQPSGSKYSKKARKATGRRRSLAGPHETSSGNNSQGGEEASHPDSSPIINIKNGQQLHSLANRAKKKSSSDSPPPPDFLPRKFLELKVVDYEVHSMEPQGPGDLWTCPFEGCYTRIHQASTARGKKSIRDHFKGHESSAEDKIKLALNESRPYLPVNNLVRRLQAVAPNLGEENLESPSRKFVAPIRRKY